jgi:hypothetical protein
MPTRKDMLLSAVYLVTNITSWEPALNLEQCDRLVESFWDDIGRDNEDHPEGTECAPSSKWIGEHSSFLVELLTFMEFPGSDGDKTILA